jgi:hypothetical protein
MLIAETDRAGRVEWVWVYSETRRHCRPVKPAIDLFKSLDGVAVSGAPKSSVVKWLIEKDCLRRKD